MTQLTKDELRLIRMHINDVNERLCNIGSYKKARLYSDLSDKLTAMIKEQEKQK